MLECVINISEGRDRAAIDEIAAAAGPSLLDVHTDADHNRSVLTVVGEAAARAVAAAAVERLDLRSHQGAHPRIGVVDVVPFVALDGSSTGDAVAARDAFCTWAGSELGVPCFRYGAERTLPDVRRGAFANLAPDCGPEHPHPTAGAIAVGQRPVLVAYNVWLAEPDLARARAIATQLRSQEVRTLGLLVGDEVQVSMNLIDPLRTGPGRVVDAVAALARIDRCELVGLVPAAVLAREPEARWDELDLSADRTIEARIRS
ncbi:glutamate formimidoyltransferase [Aquihabitans sp. McL0605]|uniref:glutamate formimidoyltransferase n=1 Tax=Aquihabitans sp. McL0605 TaxID=3415671 RepID=UPI003CED1ABB